MIVAYNDVTQARSNFVNKALFTCGSVQPISLETLVVSIIENKDIKTTITFSTKAYKNNLT